MAKRKRPTKPKPPKASAKPAVNPTALTIEQLAELLTQASGKSIDASSIEADVVRGAPRAADGTFHLIHFTAWLAAQSD